MQRNLIFTDVSENTAASILGRSKWLSIVKPKLDDNPLF
jgi:hypothetical protein